MDRVKGKVALVTGGASGIGEAAAKLLAAEGAKVAVTDIDDRNGERVTEEIKKAGGTAAFWHLDVTSEKDVEMTTAAIVKKYKKLDIVVNSAGIPGGPMPLHETPTSLWDKVMDINAKGTFLVNKYCVPYLLKNKGGSVVNISSMLGLMGGEDPVYHASKGAVRLMTKSDACTYAPHQIRFNSVHPGYILTPLFQGFGRKNPEGEQKFYDRMAAKIPQGRLGTGEDVARGILYLASDDSSYVTGTELIIDGGYLIRA
ncbi:MAG TPA: SDR family oxidoreductase [Dehalococcoidales bacterium]|nr:SDR family oxidoreductase [Dehalococcoidales bacterium]